MDKLFKIILLLIIVFLAGCNGDGAVLGKRESKIEKYLTINEKTQNKHTIQRDSNGVYIYTDRSYDQTIKPQIPDIVTN